MRAFVVRKGKKPGMLALLKKKGLVPHGKGRGERRGWTDEPPKKRKTGSIHRSDKKKREEEDIEKNQRNVLGKRGCSSGPNKEGGAHVVGQGRGPKEGGNSFPGGTGN